MTLINRFLIVLGGWLVLKWLLLNLGVVTVFGVPAWAIAAGCVLSVGWAVWYSPKTKVKA